MAARLSATARARLSTLRQYANEFSLPSVQPLGLRTAGGAPWARAKSTVSAELSQQGVRAKSTAAVAEMQEISIPTVVPGMTAKIQARAAAPPPPAAETLRVAPDASGPLQCEDATDSMPVKSFSPQVRGGGALIGDKLAVSNNYLSKVSQSMLSGIDLVVCDMAGTTVEEGGAVYEALRSCMNADGMEISEEVMHPWHGAKKEAVIEHFARLDGTPEHEIEARIIKIGDAFIETITKVYFSPDSELALIRPSLKSYFTQMRRRGIKVALDTGYPPEIQEPLVQALGLDAVVDGYVSAYQVKQGRPYPYMIYRLMEQLNICDARRVCKVGDSVRDIEEGRNAGCGLVVGVLSGADSAADMLAAGADVIADSVVDLPLPETRTEPPAARLPDFS